MMPSHYNNGKHSYRKKAFRLYEPKCEICQYDKHISILEVHHIDKNKLNSDKENLIILCSNCHISIHRGHAIMKNRKIIWRV